ncbi:MAG TPA: urea carboxylase-associated family protein [Povalibacter sp.]|uniref:urea amidolyase associated protein UAAP1 n=1 Tax=Povalibacter sp. TaxID=1962978 RepID=UPI002D16C4E5|nr:urea amidolyase associated protein UAAP1 [Povalibacter sp.]HMN46951.1 urea carboxylase-associated family protein [Povalibacter sp.]
MAEGAPYWMLWEELVAAGAHWSGLLRRGTTLRLTDVAGGANASVLFFNYDDRTERYNMPDTLKAQHTAFLTRGFVCYSDMGRVMCSLTDDTCGWHDTLCGVSSPRLVEEKFGIARYQERRNDWHQNGYESLLNELGKYGLGKRDLSASINFFSKVTVNGQGALEYHRGNSLPGSYVDLRFEMNVLMVMATSQHPLDPATVYQPREIRLTAWHSRPAPRNDPCRIKCPENERGFRNTEVWFR